MQRTPLFFGELKQVPAVLRAARVAALPQLLSKLLCRRFRQIPFFLPILCSKLVFRRFRQIPSFLRRRGQNFGQRPARALAAALRTLARGRIARTWL